MDDNEFDMDEPYWFEKVKKKLSELEGRVSLDEYEVESND